MLHHEYLYVVALKNFQHQKKMKKQNRKGRCVVDHDNVHVASTSSSNSCSGRRCRSTTPTSPPTLTSARARAATSMPTAATWKPTNYDYETDYNDHFETPLVAYEDVSWFAVVIAAVVLYLSIELWSICYCTDIDFVSDSFTVCVCVLKK